MRNMLIVAGGAVAVAAIVAGVYFGTRSPAPGPAPVAVAATAVAAVTAAPPINTRVRRVSVQRPAPEKRNRWKMAGLIGGALIALFVIMGVLALAGENLVGCKLAALIKALKVAAD